MNFPSSPVLNDQYTFGGRTWQFNGSGWRRIDEGSSSAVVNFVQITMVEVYAGPIDYPLLPTNTSTEIVYV